MTKNKTIIIVREPNVDVPEAYLRKVLAACPSGGGYAIQSVGASGPELITDNMDTGVPLSDVQDLLKSAASHRILFAFNKLEKTEEKKLQPWHVAIDGDDTLLSFAIDGHFPSMIEAGTTEESLLAHRVMFPNIQKLIKFSGGDLDKFIAELRDPTFVDMVMSRIGDRGAFCFLPPTGEAVWLGKFKAGRFPWGQVSDTLDYTEGTASAPVTATDKKKGWWGKDKGPSVPVAQETAPVVPVVPDAPPPGPIDLPKKEADTTVTPPPAPEVEVPKTIPPGHWETVQKGLSNDNRKKFIRRVTNCGGVLPDNWKVDPFFYWVTDYPKDERLLALAQQAKADKGPKDMRGAAPVLKSGADVDVLMMSKDELSAIESHILTVMNRHRKDIPDPAAILKLENKYAKFSDQFGVKLDLLHKWSPKELRLLGPKGLIHLVLELRRQDIAGVKTPPSEGWVNTDVDDQPQLPLPASSAAPDAPKKGYWGKQKAA